MASRCNSFCLLSDDPTGIRESPNLSGLSFFFASGGYSRLSPNSANLCLAEVAILIVRENIAAEVGLANVAIDAVGLAIVLVALFVEVRVIAFVTLSNAQSASIFVCPVEGRNGLAINNTTVSLACYACLFTVGAVGIAGVTSSTASAASQCIVNIILDCLSSAVDELNLPCLQGLATINGGVIVLSLNLCPILYGTVCIENVLGRCNELVLVCMSRIGRSKHVVNFGLLCSGNSYILIAAEVVKCAFIVLAVLVVSCIPVASPFDKHRLLAPAVYGAGGCLIDMEISVDMLANLVSNLQAVGLHFAALCAICDGNLSLAAGALLKSIGFP